MTLDRMHDAARLARRGNQVVPPAGRHVAAAVEPRKSRGNRVRAVKVVEQPAIQAVRAESPLDGGHVERHVVSILDTGASRSGILHNGASLLRKNAGPIVSDAWTAPMVGESKSQEDSYNGRHAHSGCRASGLAGCGDARRPAGAAAAG